MGPGPAARRVSSLDYRSVFLSSLEGPAALLDSRGNIVAVNEAWTRFGNENGGLPGSIGVGASYLDVCRKCGDATVLEGLASVLRGKAPIFRHEYRCDGPQTLRWFI